MCGITGVLSPAPLGETERSRIREMNRLLLHRGPDSEGAFESAHAMLAMRRLSIIDLAGGSQPLFNETRDIAIVCNGEIYNHHALREELKARGHHFATLSDVETIVHAYEEWGIECLPRLHGMFAFALWDGPRSRLVLARDRMGEKPLYLHTDSQGRLWFSSEMRSLFAAMPRCRITPEAFNLYLAFQYLPEPETPVDGVRVLPAGHVLVLEPGRPQAEPRAFWDPAQARHAPVEPVESVERALDEACRLMGTADVPVAIALSGGIDSSLVAALTARHFPRQLHAFTIGYSGRPPTDERGFAGVLAKSLGIGFTEVELDATEVIARFPEMVAAMDTPIGDIAAFGYYEVSRASRQAGFPVLLSGLGGDELFWGYDWVREAVGRNEALVAGRGGSRPWWRFGATPAEPEFFGVHRDLRNGDKWSRELLPEAARAQLGPGFWLAGNSLDPSLPMHLAVCNLLNRTWLRSNCLALADRMSMAHSVEMRLPLLDVSLVDHVTGMRNAGLRDWEHPHKWLLIEALRDALPADVLARKKQGFTPPIHDWMRGIVDCYYPLLAEGSLAGQGLLAGQRLREGLGGVDLPFLYKLVLLECWSRLHIENETRESLSHAGQLVRAG